MTLQPGPSPRPAGTVRPLHLPGAMRNTRWIVACLALWVGTPVLADPLPGRLAGPELEAARSEAERAKTAAQSVVRAHALRLGYGEADIARALSPAMVRSGEFTVALDDGTKIAFPWHRIGFAENRIANTDKPITRDARGAATLHETNKGGVRLHYGVFADEVYALALKMDTKLATAQDALMGHSFRGAKGGIGAGRVVEVGSRYEVKVGDHVDPASPVFDRPELMRRFAASYRAAGGDVGPGLDIQAGDVNTKAPEMKPLALAYGAGKLSPGVSGKEVLTRVDGTVDPQGGIAYRARSTGEGVWASARLAAKQNGTQLRAATVIAQGWGEVGRAFGQAAVRDGAVLLGVEELWTVDGKRVAGTLRNPYGDHATPKQVRAFMADVDAARSSGKGLDAWEGGRLLAHLDGGKGVDHYRADIVGMNAMGDVLNDKSVPRLVASGTHQGQRKIIVEGANLAETTEGARLLDHHRGALLTVPGDLANLGGVHVSNLEAAQNVFGEAVSDDKARRSLLSTMRAGYKRGQSFSIQHGVSERAGFELAAVDAMMKRSLQLRGAPRTSVERRVISKATLASTSAGRR